MDPIMCFLTTILKNFCRLSVSGIVWPVRFLYPDVNEVFNNLCLLRVIIYNSLHFES